MVAWKLRTRPFSISPPSAASYARAISTRWVCPVSPSRDWFGRACSSEWVAVCIVAALFPIFDFLPRVAQQFREGLRRIREAPAQLLACLFGLTAFAQTICALNLQPRFLGIPLLDLITACLTVLSLQIAQDCGVVIQSALTPPHFTL